MNDKLPLQVRKRAKNAPKGTERDLFTELCKSDMRVDCVKEYRFHPIRLWRFDYAILEQKIAIEVEGGAWTGGRHTRGKGFLGDMEKYNTATLMGWRVFRTTPQKLLTNDFFKIVKCAISGNVTDNKCDFKSKM